MRGLVSLSGLGSRRTHPVPRRGLPALMMRSLNQHDDDGREIYARHSEIYATISNFSLNDGSKASRFTSSCIRGQPNPVKCRWQFFYAMWILGQTCQISSLVCSGYINPLE